MKRKIYEELVKYKNIDNKKPIMVLGVRQCGKTYIIEKFCQNEYKEYYNLNLLDRGDIVDLYNSKKNSEEKYNQLKSMINFDFDKPDTILFIDEIQKSEKLISDLKFICEKHNNVNIICAGSLLGVKLKRFSNSFPVGKVWMIDMFPMDFEEYLIAFNEKMLLDDIKSSFKNNKSIGFLHEKALLYYKTYLITGGMPESVQSMLKVQKDYIKYNKKIISNIVEAYFNDMKKYVTNKNETLKIRRLYDSLPNQLANSSHKFQYSKIAKNAKSREYETPLDWLQSANMVLKVNSVTLPEKPLKGFENIDVFKLFLSDVGILNNLLNINLNDILNDNLGLYKGIIAENFVANELTANNVPLYYWKSKEEAEIDFLIETSDNGVIPIEVKSSENTKSKSLKVYNELYKPKYMIRISSKDFGYNPDTKIKSVPLYATFLIKELI